MTDKQIIIDGCNVSGCENYRPKDRFTCYPYICNCHQKPDCYFKQLARKEQEYEELRQYHNKCCKEFENEKQALLEKYNQVSINFYNGDYCNTEHCSLLKAKEQECEEPKAYAQRQENQRETYYKEFLKKDKALEEIRTVVKINCQEICGRKFEDCNDFLCTSKNILDIINKAKGEGNV